MRKFTLCQIASVQQGYTFKPEYQGNVSGKWMYVKVGDLNSQGNLKYVSKTQNYINDDVLLKMQAKPFSAGSIVFPRVGAALRCNNKRILTQDCLTDDNVLVITVANKAECFSEFLYYWFESQDLQRFCNDGSVPVINGSNLKKQIVSLPPLPEQTAISDLLSTWDEAIDKTERLIAAKEKRYSGLSGKLLFGNSGTGSATAKSTRWFVVPNHWKIVKIGNVAKEVKATNEAGETIPVLSCTKHEGLVDSLSYFGKQVFSLDTSTYKVVSRGEFAYATNHIEEGSIGYQDYYDRGLVSPMYTVFKTNQTLDDNYLYKVLKTETYRHIFQVNTSASVDRRGSLRWNEFAKLPIPLPPIEEQQQISTILNTARQEIDLLKQQVDALRRQKHGLMQKLLTGAWRVRVG
ncbi:restriction endonuclease subunit S [Geobacter hydrogenophilus]|uniref:Type I restriction endonuclease n=1 Tax=Geobacter hydrogenophilus TaxID=40983 RepID=A0A9W6G1A7_9BACT|nr:restriction endonuclease subunit S [Geobacter hydrogenophilus]MBT0892833.1 restriction endonuclease subunit S [Geobacter hydrogenophilus]GLI38691.1 type I restriction endonuclease [Geobacter hydrogenophilus]